MDYKSQTYDEYGLHKLSNNSDAFGDNADVSILAPWAKLLGRFFTGQILKCVARNFLLIDPTPCIVDLFTSDDIPSYSVKENWYGHISGVACHAT